MIIIVIFLTKLCTSKIESLCSVYQFSFHLVVKSKFDDKDVLIFGISKDSIKKHEKFCSKYSFEHELLSDESTTLCEDFGVWQEKSMYGKKYMGIVRSTFYFDETGTIQHVWPKVSVNGHVDDILNTI